MLPGPCGAGACGPGCVPGPDVFPVSGEITPADGPAGFVSVTTGAVVVGAAVVGATVVGVTVVGAAVVGSTVVGSAVVGAAVVGATVVDAAVSVAVGLLVAELSVLPKW